jgi:nitrate reductase gamma subunit
MNGLPWIYLFTYACMGVFLLAVAARAYRLFSMPIHLRWELYPVAHEPAKKARYGGSYMEDVDWWTKPRETNKLGELRVMLPEIFLLAGVYHGNRKLWTYSFPFHFGLYCMIAFLGLLGVGGIAQALGMQIGSDASVLGAGLHYLTLTMGFIGMALGLFGSIGLIVRRLTDEDLKDFTAPLDIFNLGLFAVTLAIGLVSFLFVDSSFVALRGFAQGLLTFNPQPVASGLTTVAIALGVITIAYVPLTHMSHFFTKYFMYHEVRWNDEPNNRETEMSDKIDAALGQSPTWSASHIGADGKKTWVDIATTNPESESK